jgi:hypothetical protein
VLLNLGARPNQQPQHTRSGNTQDTAAGSPNRSGRFLKPVRPLLLDLASRRQGKPVRPVWQTGQTDFVQELPKDPKHLKSLSTSEQTKPWSNRVFLAEKPFSTAHRAKPVRPVWETGQAGFCLDSREEHSPREKLNTSSNRSPIRSMDQSESLGIDGAPRGLPLARSSVPKTHSIKRNRKSTLKSTSNPRTQETPKSSTFTHGFGRGITTQRTTKGSHKFPPSNPQEKCPKNNPKKSPREGSENHHQEQPGKKHPNLEEPRRIIYTCNKGSYKV